MALIGLDLNASRIRAVSGPAQGVPRELALDGESVELPLALSLENRTPQVGQAGVAVSRKLPHQSCINFLPYLGEKRRWIAGRHQLDAAGALSLVLERVRPACGKGRGLVAALPVYLDTNQVDQVVERMEKARLLVIGSVTVPLAGALTGYMAQPWSGPALVVDVDAHALTWAVVRADGNGLLLEQVLPLPGLGWRAWTERLLDTISDRCIRQSRRDPRASAEGEQGLFDQLPEALNCYCQGKLIELGIQAAQWYQHLMLRPEELEAFCSSLARQAMDGLARLLAVSAAPTAVILTAAAARMPGLAAAVPETVGGPLPVSFLTGEALAVAAHEVAAHIDEGRLPRGHHDGLVPLPLRAPRPEVRIQPPPGRLRIID